MHSHVSTTCEHKRSSSKSPSPDKPSLTTAADANGDAPQPAAQLTVSSPIAIHKFRLLVFQIHELLTELEYAVVLRHHKQSDFANAEDALSNMERFRDFLAQQVFADEPLERISFANNIPLQLTTSPPPNATAANGPLLALNPNTTPFNRQRILDTVNTPSPPPSLVPRSNAVNDAYRGSSKRKHAGKEAAAAVARKRERTADVPEDSDSNTTDAVDRLVVAINPEHIFVSSNDNSNDSRRAARHPAREHAPVQPFVAVESPPLNIAANAVATFFDSLRHSPATAASPKPAKKEKHGQIKCSICDQRFTQRGSLIRHMRAHSGVRPYPCLICHKRFADKERLKVHNRVHTGEKPFACNVSTSAHETTRSCLVLFPDLRHVVQSEVDRHSPHVRPQQSQTFRVRRVPQEARVLRQLARPHANAAQGITALKPSPTADHRKCASEVTSCPSDNSTHC